METEKKYYHNYEFVYRDKRDRDEFSFFPNESLIEFFEESVRSKLPINSSQKFKILEAGCGQGSIFSELDDRTFHITAVDVSSSAIEMARANYSYGHISFETMDICNLQNKNEFDLVLDGHLLHCLTDDGDRKKYFQNIYDSLKIGGLYAIETMVSHRRMDFDYGYHYLPDEGILLKRVSDDDYYGQRIIGGSRFYPFRKIVHALQVENEILDTGFKIIYLRVYSNKKVIVDDSREYSAMTDPDLFRALAIKLPKV